MQRLDEPRKWQAWIERLDDPVLGERAHIPLSQYGHGHALCERQPRAFPVYAERVSSDDTGHAESPIF